jgi:copper chaperone CopZ
MSTKTIVLHVPTMHCGSCEKKIRAKLEDFSLANIVADFSTRQLSLTFSPETTRALQLKQAVESSGFAVEKMETRENA